jgi:hypothetical protein
MSELMPARVVDQFLEHEGLEQVADGVYVRPMLTIDAAIDLWLGDLARRGRATRTRASYRRYLDFFAARFPRQWDVAKVRSEDCGAFLDGYQHLSKGTQATIYAPLNGLFGWLVLTRRIKTNPMEFVPPVSRPGPRTSTSSLSRPKTCVACSPPARRGQSVSLSRSRPTSALAVALSPCSGVATTIDGGNGSASTRRAAR